MKFLSMFLLSSIASISLLGEELSTKEIRAPEKTVFDITKTAGSPQTFEDYLQKTPVKVEYIWGFKNRANFIDSCKTDSHSATYCPLDMAPCGSEWDYKDSTSTTTQKTTTATPSSCTGIQVGGTCYTKTSTSVCNSGDSFDLSTKKCNHTTGSTYAATETLSNPKWFKDGVPLTENVELSGNHSKSQSCTPYGYIYANTCSISKGGYTNFPIATFNGSSSFAVPLNYVEGNEIITTTTISNIPKYGCTVGAWNATRVQTIFRCSRENIKTCPDGGNLSGTTCSTVSTSQINNNCINGMVPGSTLTGGDATKCYQPASVCEAGYGYNAPYYKCDNPSDTLVGDKCVSGSGTWTRCANENGYCTVPYTTTVRYGQGSTYTQKTNVSGGIGCNNGVFGDPLYGVVKVCDYMAAVPATLVGSSCSMDYKYYSYQCSSGTNQFGKDWQVINAGGIDCGGQNLVDTNNDGIKDSCTLNQSASNCKREKFSCVANTARPCAEVGGTFQCSPYACDTDKKCGYAHCPTEFGITNNSEVTPLSADPLKYTLKGTVCKGLRCDLVDGPYYSMCGKKSCPQGFGVYEKDGSCWKDACPSGSIEIDGQCVKKN